jgi:hypothetical protein
VGEQAVDAERSRRRLLVRGPREPCRRDAVEVKIDQAFRVLVAVAEVSAVRVERK